MNNKDYLLSMDIDSLKKFLSRNCPPELPGDRFDECPYEVKEDCRKCWFRWLEAEHN